MSQGNFDANVLEKLRLNDVRQAARGLDANSLEAFATPPAIRDLPQIVNRERGAMLLREFLAADDTSVRIAEATPGRLLAQQLTRDESGRGLILAVTRSSELRRVLAQLSRDSVFSAVATIASGTEALPRARYLANHGHDLVTALCRDTHGRKLVGELMNTQAGRRAVSSLIDSVEGHQVLGSVLDSDSGLSLVESISISPFSERASNTLASTQEGRRLRTTIADAAHGRHRSILLGRNDAAIVSLTVLGGLICALGVVLDVIAIGAASIAAAIQDAQVDALPRPPEPVDPMLAAAAGATAAGAPQGPPRGSLAAMIINVEGLITRMRQVADDDDLWSNAAGALVGEIRVDYEDLRRLQRRIEFLESELAAAKTAATKSSGHQWLARMALIAAIAGVSLGFLSWRTDASALNFNREQANGQTEQIAELIEEQTKSVQTAEVGNVLLMKLGEALATCTQESTIEFTG